MVQNPEFDQHQGRAEKPNPLQRGAGVLRGSDGREPAGADGVPPGTEKDESSLVRILPRDDVTTIPDTGLFARPISLSFGFPTGSLQLRRRQDHHSIPGCLSSSGRSGSFPGPGAGGGRCQVQGPRTTPTKDGGRSPACPQVRHLGTDFGEDTVHPKRGLALLP